MVRRWNFSLKSCRVLPEDCSDAIAAPFGPGSPSLVCVCIPEKRFRAEHVNDA